MGSFRFRGHRIHYDCFGESDRTLVLIHGLLMNGRMYDALGPEIASCGFQVVTVDLLGHGRSDRPADVRAHSMTIYGDLVAELVEHLGLDRPVVGGTSLGANVSLEAAMLAPGRMQGLIIEMPVLDNALLACAIAFTPLLVGLTFGAPITRFVARLARRVPRRLHNLVDVGLDTVSQDPAPSAAVLQGLFFGRSAPPRSERRTIKAHALVMGHPRDPVHPFSDSDMLVRELPNARLVEASSILELRLTPERLTDEIADFVHECWHPKPRAEHAPRRAAAGGARRGPERLRRDDA